MSLELHFGHTQYVAFVDNLEIANITGSVTVTFELTATEESLFVNNGVTITTTETLTNMMFNDNANPVTDNILIYYSNYFPEGYDYVLSVPENQTLMGDITSYDFHTNAEPTEGEKYFKMGNYLTEYDPSDDWLDRMLLLSNIRQDTTYFDNTLTSDSTSYRDVNYDIITNLVLQRD